MPQLQHHRCLGRALLVAEERVMRQDQMDAGRLNVGQGAHRVLKLALESPLIVHLLVELRAHPVGLVEELEAQPAALYAGLGRGRQPRLVQLRGRNADPRAVGGAFVRNLRLRQRLSHLLRFVRIEIHVERPPVGAQRVPDHSPHQSPQQQDQRHGPAALPGRHLPPPQTRQRPERAQPPHQVRRPHRPWRAFLQLCSRRHGRSIPPFSCSLCCRLSSRFQPLSSLLRNCGRPILKGSAA